MRSKGLDYHNVAQIISNDITLLILINDVSKLAIELDTICIKYSASNHYFYLS